jgi:multisubunit Na+/H+ antiporter MnhG subunit
MAGVLARVELLKPLRHPAYRRLFAAQLASEIGDWLTLLALVSVVVYRWDLGPAGWGAVLIALTLPYAVVGPVAGVWVDR